MDVEKELREFTKDKDYMPSHHDFVRAGKIDLYQAILEKEGFNFWSRKLSLARKKPNQTPSKKSKITSSLQRTSLPIQSSKKANAFTKGEKKEVSFTKGEKKSASFTKGEKTNSSFTKGQKKESASLTKGQQTSSSFTPKKESVLPPRSNAPLFKQTPKDPLIPKKGFQPASPRFFKK